MALPSDVLPILVRLAASMVEVAVVTKGAAPVVEDLEDVVALEEALASNRMLDAVEDAAVVAVVVAAAVVDAVVAAEATEEASVVETAFVVLIETTVLNHAVEVTHAAAHLSLVARHHSCSVQKLAAAVAEPIC